MNERERHVTTELPNPDHTEPEREPGYYYYDDGTGYELYKPEQDENESEMDMDEDN